MDLGFVTIIIRIRKVNIGIEAKRTKEPIIRIKSSYLPTGRIGSFKLWSFFCFNNGSMEPLRDVFNITVKNMLKATFQIQKWGRNSITMAVFKT